MFEEADNFADIFRGGLPYCLLLTLSVLIMCSPSPALSSEFAVQRMSQFDVNGAAFGCRASALSLEAKSLYTWSTGRHCVVTKLQDMTIDQFREIRQKAGGLVVLLPQDIAAMARDDKEHLNLLEQAMLAQPNSIPIYFSQYNKELEGVIADITRTANIAGPRGSSTKREASAFSELFDTISANGYQVVISGATHTANKQSKIPIIQGELAPQKYFKQVEAGADISKLPLIIITAHLKTFGLYNEYPLNADAAVLMTLAELFSKMHNSPNAAPKYRLMFLLSEAGPLLNFEGTKKWLDENVQLQNVDFVLCLDSITPPLNNDDTSGALFMHVSKPPKEGTAMSGFYKLLRSVAPQHNNISIDGVHKKINLAETHLAWEHERFSMKRLPAFTLSALKSPRDPVRTTIFQDAEGQLLERTQTTAKVIAEALGRYIYNVPEDKEGEIFAGAMQIHERMIKAYLKLRSVLQNNDLKNGFEKYLKNVKIIYDKPDQRDPDFMFYDGHGANLNVYSVKPAVFDLFLTILICAYLAAVYFFIQFFPGVYDAVCKMSKNQPLALANNSNSYDRSKLKAN